MTRRRLAAFVTPRMLGLHLLAVVLVAAMTLLGVWQLQTYGQRQALDAAQAARLDPVPLDSLLGPDQAFTAQAHARPVVVEGEYADQQLLVARDEGGGPWVVTPLVTATGSAVPVVRGIAPGGADATAGAAPPPPGRVRVVGSLQPSQARAVDPDPTDDTVPSLSTAQLIDQVETDLYSGYVVLTEQSPPARLPAAEPPRPEPSATAGLRNLAYAVQWWVFGGFVVFMWWRMIHDEPRVA